VATALLVAQTERITPCTGTWSLNVVKSSFNPSPPVKSFCHHVYT
jgi:hypothetical protein